MNIRKILDSRESKRPLLAGVLAGLAAISLAATCQHTAATNERAGDWDCRTCTGNGEGWVPINPLPGQCKGYKHNSIMAWCKCSPNSRCESSGTIYTNVQWSETEVGSCTDTGLCDRWEYVQSGQGTLMGKLTSGCDT